MLTYLSAHAFVRLNLKTVSRKRTRNGERRSRQQRSSSSSCCSSGSSCCWPRWRLVVQQASRLLVLRLLPHLAQ